MTSFHLLSAIGKNNAVTGPGANGEPVMFTAEVTEDTALGSVRDGLVQPVRQFGLVRQRLDGS